MKNVLITNYAKGIHSKPFHEVYPDRHIVVDETNMSLSINECLFAHLFNVLPTMRRIDDNKQWFNSDLFHLS